MKEYELEFINYLFQKYNRRNYLAVRECENFLFPTTKKIKRIAMHYFKLDQGGVERVISLLVPMFMQMGYEVVVITEEINEEYDYEIPESIEIVRIPSKKEVVKSNDYMSRAQRLQDIIESKGIDTVCYHEASSFLLLYDFLVYKKSEVNFVLVKHEFVSQFMVTLEDTLYNQKSVFPLLDRILVLSRTEKQFWNTLGVRAEYIYNPLCVEKTVFYKNEPKKNIVIWVGRIVELQKQCMDVVPIMKKVVEKVPDAVLKVYGVASSPELQTKLNEMVSEELLENNIRFCGFAKDDISKIYEEAAIHLVTSAYETFPMTIYESRVSGVPLVLYKMPYLEMLKDKGGYIAVDYDDKEAAARAIVDILLNKDLNEKLSEEAVESAAAFSNEDLKNRWKEIFDSISNSQIISKSRTFEKDNDIAILLETMMYHYHKGVNYNEQWQNVFAQKAKMNEMKTRLQIAIQHKKLPVVLYPYGKIGKELKKVLNQELKLQEAFVVDNIYKGTDALVRTIEELKTLDCSKYLFLICSNNLNYYDELRNNIRKCVPGDNIVDLYPNL